MGMTNQEAIEAIKANYPPENYSMLREALDIALALLKEQEAVEPYQHDAVWLCGNCGKEEVGWDDDVDGKEYRYPFCRQCGQAVKWE